MNKIYVIGDEEELAEDLQKELFELKRNPNIIEIPDNATNGDIFQKIYKDVWDYKCEYTIDVFMESCIARFSLDWWNAPYKKGE